MLGGSFSVEYVAVYCRYLDCLFYVYKTLNMGLIDTGLMKNCHTEALTLHAITSFRCRTSRSHTPVFIGLIEPVKIHWRVSVKLRQNLCSSFQVIRNFISQKILKYLSRSKFSVRIWWLLSLTITHTHTKLSYISSFSVFAWTARRACTPLLNQYLLLPLSPACR